MDKKELQQKLIDIIDIKSDENLSCSDIKELCEAYAYLTKDDAMVEVLKQTHNGYSKEINEET